MEKIKYHKKKTPPQRGVQEVEMKKLSFRE